MNKTNTLRLIGFIIAAILPAAIFLYFKKNNGIEKSRVPVILWPIGIDSTKDEKGVWHYDTTFHSLPDFAFQTSLGDTFTLEKLKGKISVFEIFFTSCPSICPVMNTQMARVHQNLGQNKQFEIVSFTIDPERDTLDALNAYAKKYNANTATWHFLRGTQHETFLFGRNELKIPVDTTEISGDFLHSDRFILVDEEARIRGYYTGTDTADVNRMMNDAVLLLADLDKRKEKEDAINRK